MSTSKGKNYRTQNSYITEEKSLRKANPLTIYTEVEIILKYGIIELVKLSATKDVRNVSFGFF